MAEEPQLYCLCRGIDDGSTMLGCDQCEEWFHCRCIDILPEKAKTMENYVCPLCSFASEEIKINRQIRQLEDEQTNITYQLRALDKQEAELTARPSDLKRKRIKGDNIV